MGAATSELLVGLEMRLLDPEVRHNPREVAALLSDSFFEFGSSGEISTKSEIVAALQGERSRKIEASQFEVKELARDVALVTYRTNSAGVAALRSSIWERNDGAWRLIFHQGTVLPAR